MRDCSGGTAKLEIPCNIGNILLNSCKLQSLDFFSFLHQYSFYEQIRCSTVEIRAAGMNVLSHYQRSLLWFSLLCV